MYFREGNPIALSIVMISYKSRKLAGLRDDQNEQCNAIEYLPIWINFDMSWSITSSRPTR